MEDAPLLNREEPHHRENDPDYSLFRASHEEGEPNDANLEHAVEEVNSK